MSKYLLLALALFVGGLCVPSAKAETAVFQLGDRIARDEGGVLNSNFVLYDYEVCHQDGSVTVARRHRGGYPGWGYALRLSPGDQFVVRMLDDSVVVSVVAVEDCRLTLSW